MARRGQPVNQRTAFHSFRYTEAVQSDQTVHTGKIKRARLASESFSASYLHRRQENQTQESELSPIEKTSLEDKFSKSYLARFDGNTDHHHHLVCLGCDRVADLDGLKLDPIKLTEARRKGFEIADFSIHFEGYCPECRRKKTKALSPRAGLRREK